MLFLRRTCFRSTVCHVANQCLHFQLSLISSNVLKSFYIIASTSVTVEVVIVIVTPCRNLNHTSGKQLQTILKRFAVHSGE